MKVLDIEHGWLERGVKEATYVRREEPSLNRGGGLRHNLPRTYDSEINKIAKHTREIWHLSRLLRGLHFPHFFAFVLLLLFVFNFLVAVRLPHEYGQYFDSEV